MSEALVAIDEVLAPLGALIEPLAIAIMFDSCWLLRFELDAAAATLGRS